MRRTWRNGAIATLTKIAELRHDELTQTAMHRHVEPPRLALLLKAIWIGCVKALERTGTGDTKRQCLAMDVSGILNNERCWRVRRAVYIVFRNWFAEPAVLFLWRGKLALVAGLAPRPGFF